MSAIKSIPLTIYGQSTSGIRIPLGSTVEWDLGCEDPDTRAPFPLTACAVIMAVCKLDLQDNPIRPAIISRQATITDSDNGLCYVPWNSGDTVPAGVPYQPGRYSVEIWIEDVDGNRFQELLCGFIELTPAGRLPDDVIVPLPSQLPIALGPQGASNVWRGTYDAGMPYAPLDEVNYESGGFVSSYICTLATTGNLPTDATYWDLLAQGAAGGGGGGGSYTPATPAQWVSPAPTTAQQAIDRLAAVLYFYMLDGVPIPTDVTYVWQDPQPADYVDEIDRLAAVVYASVLDRTQIP